MSAEAFKQRLLPLISLPITALLGLLFFLPWVELRCNAGDLPGQMQQQFPQAPPPNATAEQKQMLEQLKSGSLPLGRASGWDLMRGHLERTIAPNRSPQTKTVQHTAANRGQAEPDQDNAVDARPWFGLGLLAPFLIAVGAIVALMNASVNGWGKWTMLLALVGATICVLGTTVNYAADVPGGQQGPFPAMQKAAHDMLENVLVTRPARYDLYGQTIWPLWYSLGGYVLLLLIGIVAAIQPDVVEEVKISEALAGPPSGYGPMAGARDDEEISQGTSRPSTRPGQSQAQPANPPQPAPPASDQSQTPPRPTPPPQQPEQQQRPEPPKPSNDEDDEDFFDPDRPWLS